MQRVWPKKKKKKKKKKRERERNQKMLGSQSYKLVLLHFDVNKDSMTSSRGLHFRAFAPSGGFVIHKGALTRNLGGKGCRQQSLSFFPEMTSLLARDHPFRVSGTGGKS